MFVNKSEGKLRPGGWVGEHPAHLCLSSLSKQSTTKETAVRKPWHDSHKENTSSATSALLNLI